MDEKLRILIVEDVATDAELIQMELDVATLQYETERVESKEVFKEKLLLHPPDIILSDYSLPKFTALEALQIRNQININIPFILVTGNQTEEIAVECIKNGADDYVLKSSLTRLPSAIQNALQKKKAETAFINAVNDTKAREEKYRNLFENSLVGMFRASSENFEFIELNEKAKNILRIKNPDLISFDTFFDQNEFHRLENCLSECCSGIENFETEITRCDGTKCWISVSATFYKNESVIEGVILDISQTKHSFIELEKANYELDRFTYHASHDLRSPLRSLEGLIQASLEEDNLDELKVFLKMMQKSTVKLENLIDDLLTIARNKKSEAKITKVDFYQELEDALIQLGYYENSTKINIHRLINQTNNFSTDGVRLRIILTNLISNAIKYHNLNQENPQIWIDINVQEDFAHIKIRDNGKGIAAHHQEKIFDMFYRADSSCEGSGLGLYLVKTTVDKLHGKISLLSSHGQGTEFVIQIPNFHKIKENSILIKEESNLEGRETSAII